MCSAPTKCVLSFAGLKDPGSAAARSRATEGFSAMTRVLPIPLQDTQIERHSATGWWLEEAGRVEARRPLGDSVDADVVVIGGGYTGMWTAWHLLEAGARVALLEAGLCGHGPSGRNGGFCESLWLGIATLRERLGDEPARRL